MPPTETKTTKPRWPGGTLRPDVRYNRAMRLTAHLMHLLNPILDMADPELDLPRRVSRIIQDEMMAEGVEVFTDYDRQEAGLPPRGLDGWTVEELLALEKMRLDALTRPMPHFIAKEP